MRKYKKLLKQQKQAEKETLVSKPTSKPKEEKVWLKQFQWKSEKDFNNYPKWWGDKSTYNQDWHKDRWGRYRSSDGILDSLKKDLRSKWQIRYIQGRNWRAYNEITGEIIEFPDIENYYN
jgi:hypothetical protein